MNPRFEKRVTAVVIHRRPFSSFAFHVSDSGFALLNFYTDRLFVWWRMAMRRIETERMFIHIYIYIDIYVYFGFCFPVVVFTGYTC